MPETQNIRVRQSVEGGDVEAAIKDGLKSFNTEVAAAEGMAMAGPVKVKHTVSKKGDEYVTVTGKVSDVPASGDVTPMKARHNLDPEAGTPVDAAVSDALSELRGKALAEGMRIVADVKATVTTTKKGDKYVTASAKVAPIDGVIATGRQVLVSLEALGSDASAKDYKDAVKPLKAAVKDAQKFI